MGKGKAKPRKSRAIQPRTVKSSTVDSTPLPAPWAELPIAPSTDATECELQAVLAPLVTPSDTSATAFCIDCGEPEVPLRLIASCGHNMCAPCLSQRLKVALNLEIFCPVKCCETSLLKINIHKLGEQDDSLRNIADRLKPKVFDYMIDRYGRLEISCCGAFMKPADKPGWNECKKCWEKTCKRCGELYHGTTLCIIDQPQDEAQYGMILQESEAITNDKTHVPEGEDGGKDNSW